MANVINVGGRDQWGISDMFEMAAKQRYERQVIQQREDESWLGQGRAIAEQAIAATKDPREGVKFLAKWLQSNPERTQRIFGGNAPDLSIDPSLANQLGDKRNQAGIAAFDDPTQRALIGTATAADMNPDAGYQRVLAGASLGGRDGAIEAHDLNTGYTMTAKDKATTTEQSTHNRNTEGETHRSNVVKEGFEGRKVKSTETRHQTQNELDNERKTNEIQKRDPNSPVAKKASTKPSREEKLAERDEKRAYDELQDLRKRRAELEEKDNVKDKATKLGVLANSIKAAERRWKAAGAKLAEFDSESESPSPKDPKKPIIYGPDGKRVN